MQRGVFVLLVLGLIAFACSGSETSTPTSVPIVATFVSESAAPVDQLVADYNAHINGSFKVTYETTISGATERTEKPTVTWYKDGSDRQRFDFSGSKAYALFDRTSVFTKGDRDRTMLCSDDLPVTPTDQDGSGPTGACCEGSSSCGDLAANMIVLLGFPIGYRSGEDLDRNGLAEFNIEISRRQIAGVDARCYVLTSTRTPTLGEDNTPNERCFAANGAMLSWNHGYLGIVKVEATSVGNVQPSDFEYPYAVYTDPNEGR